MVKKIIGIGVLLLVLGMAVPPARAWILDVISPVTDNLRARMVPGKLAGMADQLEVQYRRTGRFPSGDVQWVNWLEKSYTGRARDPWGNLYFIKPSRGGDFTVGSMGPDARQGTADDITERRRPR